MRQAGLRFGSCQRRLRLLQRGAIGSVIYREQHLALFHLLAVGVIHFINVSRDARAKLNALHRFNATVKTIPLTDRLHQHLSGADRRGGRRSILRDAVVAADEQKGEHHRAERGQVNVSPGFLQAHYFYSGKCSRRARRSVRSRATSFVRAGLRPFVSIIATKL
ncbi:hypothetical protein [Klebsiella pneumoniae IS46]|nr:hypothetical protein [Klebsiella pneumoniae IS46]CDL21571.1 hypothetical protein [Klebsiella pneumoniae IS53]